VQDLEAQALPDMVEVMWSIPGEGQEGVGYTYSIQKSEIRWEDRNCPTCPGQPLQEVQAVNPAHPEPASIRAGKIVWQDRNVVLGNAYRYQVAVLDQKGRALSHSNFSSVKIIPPPAEPQDLRAEPTRKGIVLTWKMPRQPRKPKTPQGELQFIVDRRLEGGAWERISPVPITGATFTDSAIMPSQFYDYKVIPLAIEDGASMQGNPAAIGHVQAPDEAPPSPPSSAWVLPAKGVLEVHWTESSGKVGGYHVYRREDKEIVRLTAEPIQGPPFIDRNVKPNVVYQYAISSVGPTPPYREGLLSKWVEIRNVVFE
jgi:hypothetical protein